jgi:hypothetical protein
MPTKPGAAQLDRMILEIPGGGTDRGREIASLVAAGLASAGALPAAGDLPVMRVAIRAAHQESAQSLARRIVARLARDLAQLQ